MINELHEMASDRGIYKYLSTYAPLMFPPGELVDEVQAVFENEDEEYSNYIIIYKHDPNNHDIIRFYVREDYAQFADEIRGYIKGYVRGYMKRGDKDAK